MYRERCRPKYSAPELKDIYHRPWEFQWDWEDHKRRLAVTETVAERMITEDVRTAGDLSCGDGYWKEKFQRLTWFLGDFAGGYEYRGPIEETINKIPHVDVFFLCETLEHLDDPDSVLVQIREKADRLILSTPKSWQWDENPEHYWAWDAEALQGMLGAAGWRMREYEEANGWNDPTRVNGYAFQIWGCV